MKLEKGSKLGPYEVTGALGAGGMGEVYRASDTKLRREVALKVLPEIFAGERERMARFEREAQVLASLSHPHIAAVYGLEDSGGVRALVMELVEGPTLAERIAQGALPLDEALAIARQMAEALEAAHEKGIVHRDLKPANVKLTKDGAVKVLDFGLAKALEEESSQMDMANSPTISMAATRAGVILGTAAYMAPEQARGKTVDRRADIWSFGCVLFEMLAGRAAYRGETASDILAQVITQEPDWSALPGTLPPRIEKLLRRCLSKEPKQRLQAIGEARIAIEEYLANPAGASGPLAAASAAPQAKWRRTLPWLGMAAMALLAATALWRPWEKAVAPLSARFVTEFAAGRGLYAYHGTAAVLAPDGTRIAYVVSEGADNRRLYIRTLDQTQPVPLAGTEGARDPFFSPDGQWIAFFAPGQLKKISVQGGTPVTICDSADDRGGAWGEDGTILFTPGTRLPLMRVSAAGGQPEPFSVLKEDEGEVTHRWPQWVRHGEVALYTVSPDGSNYENSDIVAQVVATGERKTLVQGGYHARYLPGGKLVFMRRGTLYAIPLDLKTLETKGQPVPVLDEVMSNVGNAGAQFSFSQTGLFVYVAGKNVSENLRLDWLWRDGKITPARKETGAIWDVAVSPDGQFLAFEMEDGNRRDAYIQDLRRDTTTRLTFDGKGTLGIAWTPDSKRLTFGNRRKDGTFGISWKRADGAGGEQSLVDGLKKLGGTMSWRPDGRTLAFSTLHEGTSMDIMTLTMEGDQKTGWRPGEIKPLLNSKDWEGHPAFSPDGRWLAYISTESGGLLQAYVRPFPGPGGKWQISSSGAILPQWGANGRELFYKDQDGRRVMVTEYTAAGDSFYPGKTRQWSDAVLMDRGADMSYAPNPDGQRVVAIRNGEVEAQSQVTRLTFILNFFDEVARKLAPGQP